MADATESTGAGLAEQMPSDQSPSAQQVVTPQRSSLRQANRNTFKRMLQQKQQEEQEFALFERTVEARLRRAKRPAPSSPQPPVAAAAEAGEDGVIVVVKRRRGRPPKPRPPQPPKPLLIGMCVQQVTFLHAGRQLPHSLLVVEFNAAGFNAAENALPTTGLASKSQATRRGPYKAHDPGS